MKTFYFAISLAVSCLAFYQPGNAQNSVAAIPVIVTVKAVLLPGNKIMFSWTMLARVSAAAFVVEKSGDGNNWQSVDHVQPYNEGGIPFTYSTTDLMPGKGNNYYRLRILDVNGNSTISLAKNIFISTAPKMNIYPNPARSQVNVSLGQLPDSEWTVTLLNNIGQAVTSRKLSNKISVCTIGLDGVPGGYYFIRIDRQGASSGGGLVIN